MLLERFDKVTEISKGMSGDKKYKCIDREGHVFLLRSSDLKEYDIKLKEYEFLKKLNKSDLPIPKCIDFMKEGDSVYTLLSWIDGEETEKVLPHLNEGEQYEMGVKAGKILAKIHKAAALEEDPGNWYDRYFEVIDPRLEAYRTKGIAFEGADLILDFIEENKYLLKQRKQCGHHGDYHMGNLITKNGEVFVIDWHTVDFDNIGDPWYEFNRVGVEYPAFASGQIDGYFDGNIPEEFWKLFALYHSASAVTSIVWAKYYAPSKLDSIIKLNKNVLAWFDNMERAIPTWYLKDNYSEKCDDENEK
ncbi:MAG: aminoglycoside phosphotransferase family protein [Huintestinicola sp.]